MAGLWASGVSAFESEKNEKAAPGNCRLKARGRAARDAVACPVCKSLWKERDGVWGKGRGKLFFRKVPVSLPQVSAICSIRCRCRGCPLRRNPSPMSCIPTGRPSASPTGNERPGSPARFAGHGVDVHEVHLERIINDGAELPRRDRGDGAEKGVAGAERVQVVLADEAADLRGLLVVGVVVPGGQARRCPAGSGAALRCPKPSLRERQ